MVQRILDVLASPVQKTLPHPLVKGDGREIEGDQKAELGVITLSFAVLRANLPSITNPQRRCLAVRVNLFLQTGTFSGG